MRGVGAALIGFPRHADLVPHVGGDELAADDADGGGDRRIIGKDRVGGAGDVISPAAGNVAHGDDQRFFGFHALRWRAG